jgi:hypothetical protein
MGQWLVGIDPAITPIDLDGSGHRVVCDRVSCDRVFVLLVLKVFRLTTISGAT